MSQICENPAVGTGMVNLVCTLGWTTGRPDIWPNIILSGVSEGVSG